MGIVRYPELRCGCLGPCHWCLPAADGWRQKQVTFCLQGCLSEFLAAMSDFWVLQRPGEPKHLGMSRVSISALQLVRHDPPAGGSVHRIRLPPRPLATNHAQRKLGMVTMLHKLACFSKLTVEDQKHSRDGPSALIAMHRAQRYVFAMPVPVSRD